MKIKPKSLKKMNIEEQQKRNARIEIKQKKAQRIIVCKQERLKK
jgi:hypothetical protein